MRRLWGFLTLTGLQRRIVVRALIMLPLTALGLRLAGFRRVQALLAIPATGAPGNAEEIERLVCGAASHGLYRASCLPTSLTLQWILRHHGIESDLRLGVRRTGRGIEAHAWLEHLGEPLRGAARDAAQFAAFEPADPSRAR